MVFVGQVHAVEPLDLDLLTLLLLILVSSPSTPRPRINDFLYCSTSASAVADEAENEEFVMTALKVGSQICQSSTPPNPRPSRRAWRWA